MKIYIPTFILLSLLTYAKLLYAYPPYDSGSPINCLTFQGFSLALKDQKKILSKYKKEEISKATAAIEKDIAALSTDPSAEQNITTHQSTLKTIKDTPDDNYVVNCLTLYSDSNHLFDPKSVTKGNAPLIANTRAIGRLNLWLILKKLTSGFHAVGITEVSDTPPNSDLLGPENGPKLLAVINKKLQTGDKGSLDTLLVNETNSVQALFDCVVTDDERLKAEGNFSTEKTFSRKLNYLINQHRAENDGSPLNEAVNNAFEGTTLIIDPQKFINNPNIGTKTFPHDFFKEGSQIHEDAVKELFEPKDRMEKKLELVPPTAVNNSSKPEDSSEPANTSKKA